VQWLLNGRRFSQLAPNEEGIKEGKIKGDLNHKCMLEVGMFDNAPMPIRSSKPL
jgi:hypothetical protein